MKENERLKELTRDFIEGYQNAADTSRTAFLESIPDGKTAYIPPKGQIIGDEFRAGFDSDCQRICREIDNILHPLIEKERNARTAPPSSEAVNIITLMNVRNNITAKEITELLDRYGDNYQARRALLDIARNNDIDLYEPFDDSPERYERLSDSLKEWVSIHSADNEKITSAYKAIVDNEIDVAFGEADPIFPTL